FTDADVHGQVGDYSATITWGDDQTSSGTVAADPNVPGQFDVLGNHAYTEDGIYSLSVTISDVDANNGTPAPPPARSTATVGSKVTVNDAPLTLAGVPAITTGVTEGKQFTVVVGTLTDFDPNGIAGNPQATPPVLGDYVVSINWGDGTAPSAGT